MSSNARALANRRNGAMSSGPKTALGKRRAARNAIKHGLCARRMVLLADEDAAAFGAFEAAVRAELGPVGALQSDLVARIVIAAWRARRADRLEAALLGRHLDTGDFVNHSDSQAALGSGLIRDGNGPRALETLLRYRGSVLAELFRSRGVLRLLQTEPCVLSDGPAALPKSVAAPRAVVKTKRTQKNVAKQ